MAEELDYHLLLVTAPQEAARAAEHRAQGLRQAKARVARERAMAGPLAAKKALDRAWAPLLRNVTLRDLDPKLDVYQGEGPPEGQPPGALLNQTYYLDTLTGVLYRLEAA